MFYLIGSIITSALLTVSFKQMEIWKINTFQAIVFNYFVAASLGIATTSKEISLIEITNETWFPFAFGLGCMFIGILNLIAFAINKIGITVVTVSNKMSVVIPVTISFIFYGDQINVFKIVGLVLAVIAVVFTSIKKQDLLGTNNPKGSLFLLLPICIFIISGIGDSIVNYLQRTHLTNVEFPLFLTTVFGTAGILGLGILLIRFLGKEKIHFNSILVGILVGLINYGTMYFMLKCLNGNFMPPSIFFPINNMGILSLTTFLAFFGFKEKLSRLNWGGIFIALLSIAIISMS